MQIENGSGGHGTGVKTTFEDGDDGDDFSRHLIEVGKKVDSVYSDIGRTVLHERTYPRSVSDLLGFSAVRPQLDIPTLDEITSPYLPVPQSTRIRDLYN